MANAPNAILVNTVFYRLAIVDSIDESGYLTISADEVGSLVYRWRKELDEVECGLKRIQFWPIGSGSPQSEKFIYQTKSKFSKKPWLAEAKIAINRLLWLNR